MAAAYRAGLVTRDDLFLQTKFTYRPGQDHRLPCDPAASLSVQVAQSMASSLDHLATGYVDSYVLHGPSSNHDWTDADNEVWEAMQKERDAGRARFLGVSNVSLRHLGYGNHPAPPPGLRLGLSFEARYAGWMVGRGRGFAACFVFRNWAGCGCRG